MKHISITLLICSLSIWLFYSGSPPTPQHAQATQTTLQTPDQTPNYQGKNECLSSLIYFVDYDIYRFSYDGKADIPQFGIKKGKSGVVSFLKLHGSRFENEAAAYQYYQQNKTELGEYMTLTIANPERFPAFNVKGYCRDVSSDAPELMLNKTFNNY